ncbi:MAG: hypothetical protein SPJ06_04610 [Bacilli bacterium]|nr:hypothetical protein [Bacilli bacterium]
MADFDSTVAAQGATIDVLENVISSKKSISYSDSLSIWSDDDIEIVLESLRDLRNSAEDFYSSFSKAENDIIYCSWYNTATRDSEFYDHVWNNVINGTGFEAETLKNIFYDDGKETGGLKGFNDAPNFSHLISAIEELRQAIIDYSNGTNVYAARDILSTLINIGEGDDSFLGNSSYYGAASVGTLSAPGIESIEPTKTVETPKNEDVTPIFSTDIEKNDELDGADNIPMEDSVTDNIANISAKDLLIDAVKNSNGIVSAGATSVLGNAFSKGIGSSNKIDSKLEAEKIDDIIEPEEPIPNLDEDEDNLFDDVVSTVTSIVTPDVPTTTINGKNVEGKSGSSIAIPAIAGVGVASAGVVGGKVYMDKKNNDDDSENDDDNKFDDFEFDNTEEKQEEVVNNNDSKENVVDFKNKIMNDNL